MVTFISSLIYQFEQCNIENIRIANLKSKRKIDIKVEVKNIEKSVVELILPEPESLDGVGQNEKIQSEGIQSEGIQSEGIQSEGIQSEGIQSEGIQSEGIESEGIVPKVVELFEISPNYAALLRSELEQQRVLNETQS